MALRFKTSIYLTIVSLLTCGFVQAQCPSGTTPTYITDNANGSWTNAGSWTTGAPPYTLSSNTYTIPSTDVVQVNSANFALNSNLTVEGILILDGKLNMAAGTVIYIAPGGRLCCTSSNCNPSDRLTIGGNSVWDGDDGPVTGPATSDGTQALPVELLYFNVSAHHSGFELSWATSTETDFNKFVIERSADGKVFESVGEVAGQGRNVTDIVSRYSFIDHTPIIGYNYYRLKAIDLDESFEYFGMVAARVNADKAMTVFPNPSSGNELNFYTNFNPSENDRIVVRNSVGEIIYQGHSPKANNHLKLSSGQLSPGVYFLEYHGSDHKQVVRFFVK